MQIEQRGELPLSSDFEQICRMLPLSGARLLELGCGTALTTRRLAESTPVSRIIAMEVDRLQHDKNRQATDLPNVEFRYGAAQDIDLPDAAVDAVIMLKSLHHVPIDDMDKALTELHRVLRPGGLAYISEPVYAGAFNDILRLFNDERTVRRAAFEALRRALDHGMFDLAEEVHFSNLARFDGFADFEQRILGATHSEFSIDDTLYAEIRRRFQSHLDDDGVATFHNPTRVDLLRKPASG